MSGSKVKGLLKGLRYISQMFDNEKEQEIQIGYPTDVKHVAHIGWDGPSVNSPSWMNEFKAAPGFASAPLSLTGGDVQNRAQDNAVQWVSEDSSKRSSRRNLPDLPKSSRRPLASSVTDSPTKERSDKPKQSRRPSKPKDPLDGPRPARQFLLNEGDDIVGSPSRVPPDIPKKSRRKKSKDSNGGGGSSSKLRPKAQSSSDPNSGLDSPTESISDSRNKQRSFEENGDYERGGASEIS